MSDDTPDWETAARRSIPGEMIEAGDRVADECRRIGQLLEEGEQVTADDIERLTNRLQELEYRIDRQLSPIVVTDTER